MNKTTLTTQLEEEIKRSLIRDGYVFHSEDYGDTHRFKIPHQYNTYTMYVKQTTQKENPDTAVMFGKLNKENRTSWGKNYFVERSEQIPDFIRQFEQDFKMFLLQNAFVKTGYVSIQTIELFLRENDLYGYRTQFFETLSEIMKAQSEEELEAKLGVYRLYIDTGKQRIMLVRVDKIETIHFDLTNAGNKVFKWEE